MALSEKPGKKERVELSPETAALIVSMNERLDKLDLFTLLDVDLNASSAILRRAYFRRSLLFHPDRYFSRDMGPYKPMLERIFAFISASYDFLKDDRRRAAYRKKILSSRDEGGLAMGGVTAVQTARGLEFKIVDEKSFYASDEPSAAGGEADRQVVLPQKKYALPRLRTAAAAPPQPGEAAAPPAAAEEEEAEEEGLDFSVDISFDD